MSWLLWQVLPLLTPAEKCAGWGGESSEWESKQDWGDLCEDGEGKGSPCPWVARGSADSSHGVFSWRFLVTQPKVS